MLGKLSMIGAVAAIIMIPPQRCPPKSGALPASRRQHRPQLVRRALPGAAHEAHHPKLAAGAPSKIPTARIAWPGRSDPASASMFRTDSRQAKCVQGLVHPWRRDAFRRSIQWIGGNCARPQPIVATVSQYLGRKPLRTRRRQPQTKGQKPVCLQREARLDWFPPTT